MDEDPEYIIQRTSNKTADLATDIWIGENSTHRKVMKVELLDDQSYPDAPVGITLRYQRRHSRRDPWEDPDCFSAASLKGGEEVKYPLGHRETLKLFKELPQLYDACGCGIPQTSGVYRLVSRETGEIIDNVETDILKLLIDKNPDFLSKLKDLDPDISIVESSIWLDEPPRIGMCRGPESSGLHPNTGRSPWNGH